MTPALGCGLDSHSGKDYLEETAAAAVGRSAARGAPAAGVTAVTAFAGVAKFEAIIGDSAAAADARLLRLSVQC